MLLLKDRTCEAENAKRPNTSPKRQQVNNRKNSGSLARASGLYFANRAAQKSRIACTNIDPCCAPSAAGFYPTATGLPVFADS